MAENQNPIQSIETQERYTLPAMIARAARALASATTAGEILEAKHHANVAYFEAKSLGRMARARKAHDEVIGAVYRAQANALEIEARAKIRLADEYDAAQERGEVKRNGGDRSTLESRETASAADLGLRHDQIQEARQLRNAEAADPGFIRKTLSDMVEAGE